MSLHHYIQTFCGNCGERFKDLPKETKECPICESKDSKYLIPQYEQFIYDIERRVKELASELEQERKKLRTAKKGLEKIQKGEVK